MKLPLGIKSKKVRETQRTAKRVRDAPHPEPRDPALAGRGGN